MNKIFLSIIIIYSADFLLTLIEMLLYMLNRVSNKILKRDNVSPKEKNILVFLHKRFVRFDKDVDISSKLHSILEVLATINICIFSVILSYYIIYEVIKISLFEFNLNENIYAYISLTILLLVISYFPEKIIFGLERMLNLILWCIFKKSKLVSHKTKKLDIYESIAVLLKPKLWVYLISIIITVISSIEKISGAQIIVTRMWVQIKPIVIESVMTMIVVDRFVTLLKGEFKNIKSHFTKIKREI